MSIEENNTWIIAREDIFKHPILRMFARRIHDNQKLLKYSDVKKVSQIDQSVIILNDPLVLLSVFVIHSIFFKRNQYIFLSSEMYEFQEKRNSFRNYLRNFVFYIAHKYSQKIADFIVFPNQSRRSFYLNKKWHNKSKSTVIKNDCVDKSIVVKQATRKKWLSFMKKNNLERKKIYIYSGTINDRNRGIGG